MFFSWFAIQTHRKTWFNFNSSYISSKPHLICTKVIEPISTTNPSRFPPGIVPMASLRWQPQSLTITPIGAAISKSTCHHPNGVICFPSHCSGLSPNYSTEWRGGGTRIDYFFVVVRPPLEGRKKRENNIYNRREAGVWFWSQPTNLDDTAKRRIDPCCWTTTKLRCKRSHGGIVFFLCFDLSRSTIDLKLGQIVLKFVGIRKHFFREKKNVLDFPERFKTLSWKKEEKKNNNVSRKIPLHFLIPPPNLPKRHRRGRKFDLNWIRTAFRFARDVRALRFAR